jgi:phospholipase C
MKQQRGRGVFPILGRCILERRITMANQLPAIKYIVQLMLENRSFDQMLGFLYSSSGNLSPTNQPFDGLTGNETNPDDAGRPVKVYKIDVNSPHPYLMPGADPGEGFKNTNYQLFSTDDPHPGSVPSNQGFVINFKAAIQSDLAKGFKDTLPGTDASEIMGMYSPEMLPIMSALARGFAVCDQWFSSAPTQTIPNRTFAAAATSQGHLDNHVKVFTCPSIFGKLSAKNIDWAIYGYNRDPLTRLDFTDTQHEDESHFGHFRDFQTRAAAGKLPPYTFLEPGWSATGNSQHPNYDLSLGEQLIRDTYRALRDGPGWNDTLLLITYDEHGGNYDHVGPPSTATPPGDNTIGEWGFDFTRFGVRIPALLISPRIAAGTVFRAKRGTIDHTSVLKTIELRFGLDPLTERDKAAPDLGDVLTLATPRTDDPLKDVQVPATNLPHPEQEQSEPSLIEKIHAHKVSLLPLRNDQGSYDRHEPPDLSTSAKIGDYIQGRTAAWTQHLERQRAKRARHPGWKKVPKKPRPPRAAKKKAVKARKAKKR